MGFNNIGVALVEVEVVLQHILAFQKTETFPDQSRDSMTQGKVILFDPDPRDHRLESDSFAS